MKLDLIAVCDQAIIDHKSNRLSLISLLDDLRVAGLPAIIQQAVLVLQFKKLTNDSKDHHIKVEVKIGEKVLATSEVDLIF